MKKKHWIIIGVIVVLLLAGGAFFYMRRKNPQVLQKKVNDLNAQIAKLKYDQFALEKYVKAKPADTEASGKLTDLMAKVKILEAELSEAKNALDRANMGI